MREPLKAGEWGRDPLCASLSEWIGGEERREDIGEAMREACSERLAGEAERSA